MPSTRSGASYNPSRSSQKGYRHDCGRANQLQKNKGKQMYPKLKNYAILKLIILFNLQQEITPPQEASVNIYKAIQKAYNNALQHKEYQILADLWKNYMNSYLTVRKFLGHPKTYNLLNGWHSLMEKKYMMLLTAEWRKTTLHLPSKFQEQTQ
ncbi:hypothetical protein O181_040889 [Austropuccinia psidii MF-1]|uniref:Uncharacterized protein n=1 Tax=Austropuccinia psidii MF-1 TaxID=1389203 RepID=A0A9Q3HFZ5_9BASI|nr:hypothetical protein [Austropuccinia psidii MF-1]